jgi:hypothetical protein
MRIAHVLILSVMSAVPLTAQHPGRATPAVPATGVPVEAAQFDFLIGQWDLVVKPKASGLAARIHGAPRLLGTWKAWKALDGRGVQDELRIVDASGNPSALSLAVRVWSAADRRWNATSVDAYRGRVSTSSATWSGSVMEASGKGFDPAGAAVTTRTRFTAITPSSFRFTQDRSADEGRTWEEGVLVIEAKRVSATAPR